jgi:hypothetical protein
MLRFSEAACLAGNQILVFQHLSKAAKVILQKCGSMPAIAG